MVDAYVQRGEEMIVETERQAIQKDKYRNVKNTVLKKRFRVVNKKRVIRNDFTCVPFGYKE